MYCFPASFLRYYSCALLSKAESTETPDPFRRGSMARKREAVDALFGSRVSLLW